MLVSALIQCHYDYSCNFWYESITQTSKNKLDVTQRKAIRLILGIGNREHINYLNFKQAGFLPITYRVNMLKLTQTFKINKGIAPSYLNENFHIKDHKYNTRSGADSYKIDHHKTPGQHTFKHTGSILWNQLPKSIKNVEKYEQFKQLVKKHMWEKFEKAYQNEFLYY